MALSSQRTTNIKVRLGLYLLARVYLFLALRVDLQQDQVCLDTFFVLTCDLRLCQSLQLVILLVDLIKLLLASKQLVL